MPPHRYTANVAHLLQPDAYARARAFLDAGRPLEAAAFAHALEGGPAWQVLDALAVFQNPDGGFGHGLEPDLLCGSSSALATSVALRRLAALDVPANHAVVEGALGWARRAIDPHARTWRIVPTDAGSAPHAPWWDAEGLEERFNAFTLNPKAEMLAQLYTLGAGEDGWLDRLADDVVREIENRLAARLPLDMHELIACVSLVDAPHVPVQVRRRLHELLAPLVDAGVERDPEAWRSYELRPLAVAPRPGCAFAGQLAEVVELELEYLLHEQADDGGWWPTWTWGRDEDVWLRQQRVWAGVLTLEALVHLDRYGRVER